MLRRRCTVKPHTNRQWPSSRPAAAALPFSTEHCQPVSTAERIYSKNDSKEVPRWLASLALLGAGVFVAGLHTERVPITGRFQLLFSIYRPPVRDAMTGEACSASMYAHFLPKTAQLVHPTTLPGCHKLEQEGLQLMQLSYQATAVGVESLAQHDAALRSRLARLPATMLLFHSLSNLQPQAGFAMVSEENFRWSRPLSFKAGTDEMFISAQAGLMLGHQTLDSLMWTFAHELGHAIGNHKAEEKSWCLLLSALSTAQLCLSKAVSAKAKVPVAFGLTYVVTKLVPFCLDQQQEYEADAIGMNISLAAGCSHNDIVNAMSAWYCSGLIWRKRVLADPQADAAMQAYLTALQHNLPGSQIPQQLLQDSKGLQLVADAAAQELACVTQEVKNRVSSIMLDLRSCVAKQLWASRDEWGQWISDHPHWEYRIGRVKQLLKDVPPLPELSLLDKQTLATRRKDAKQLIKQYQDSKDWPEALAYLTFTYTNPRTCFEVAEKLRRMSPEAQRQMAAEDASREYDLQTRLAVLGMSIRHTDFGCKFERCFKAAMQLFRGQSQQAKA
ncbi:TPA: hypothetical protein ACH3X2_011163 [Trebouxia sp. C0005]